MKKKRTHQFKKIILKIFCGVFLVWIFGFLMFLVDAFTIFHTPPPTDGIVALTGGSGRIDASIRLLEIGYGKYLLISGVGQKATLTDLEKQLSHPIKEKYRNNIILGHNAASTFGNAVETAAWVHCYNLKSLIIVTSNYHIRRAMLEIKTILPQIKLYPFVVQPLTLKSIYHLSYIRLFFIEYNKWLAAYIGLIHTRHSDIGLLDKTYEAIR